MNGLIASEELLWGYVVRRSRFETKALPLLMIRDESPHGGAPSPDLRPLEMTGAQIVIKRRHEQVSLSRDGLRGSKRRTLVTDE